jgi:tetratricopeptide (TPR) repeat protein
MRKYLLLIILLVLAIYYNSFGNKFVWDDEFLIVNNPAIMAWRHAWIHFAVDLYHSFSNYYRPIQMITYMIDFSLWRLNPLGYHLTNVLLHIFVSLSVFMLLKLTTEDVRIAFAGTLFYAVHPAHTAAVTYIAGRADSLTTLFSLLSLIAFHWHFKVQNTHKVIFLYIFSLVSFILALLSKEIAVVFPAIILSYRLFFISDNEVERSRNAIKFHYISPFVVILSVYLILRSNVLNFLGVGYFESSYPLYSRLLTSLKAYGVYLGIIFFPIDLHMERGIPAVPSFFEKDVLLSGLLFLFVLWLAIRVGRSSKPASFGFLFFIISLLPVMNIYPVDPNMAEHWLYTPLIGVTMFLSCLGVKLWDVKENLRPALLFILVFYLIFFSYQTVERNFDWQDEYAIYTNTFNYNPKSIKVLNNLGGLYYKRGDYDKAIIFHKKALKINPYEHKTIFNIGYDYEAMGMPDEALMQYKKCIQYMPNYAKAYFNSGNIYAERKEYDKAIAAYQHAAQYDEFHIGARNNLGNIYFDRGLYEKAKEEYEEVIRINPYLPAPHSNLGNTLSRLGRYEEAIKEYKKAVELAPANADYYAGLGMVYGELRRYDEAIEEFKEAYRLNPKDAEIIINIGVSYFHKGDFSAAEKEWQKALSIDPGNNIAVNYLKGLQNYRK